MKEPWLNYPHIWKTKAAFFSYIRGGIRRSLWNRAPQKIEYINKHRKRIKNPNPKGRVAEVWGGICALCGGEFPQNMLEVDHRVGNNSLKDFDDILPFILAISCVSEDDLQLVCKPCHRIKTLCERNGTTFEQARAEKVALALVKAKKDLTWLEERGIVALRSQKARREQIVEQIIKERNNESPE